MSQAIMQVFKLGFPWQTIDPFLFCAHHDDAYPPGNEQMGPDPALLQGRQIGMDFTIRDGWRMYHGDVVPGFPAHPHRGFETVTLARHGYIDHSDSLGAAARFGDGDVQWLTTGAGIVHSEMFPLVHADRGNRTELFQIWLNLARADKMADPHFRMIWRDQVAHRELRDEADRAVHLTTVSGVPLGDDPATTPRMTTPPPASWAAREDSHVRIATIRLAPGARWTLPEADPKVNRVIYFFRGDALEVAGQSIPHYSGVRLDPSVPAELVAGVEEAELLLLEGRPIGEPVAQQGPFVMNSPMELRETIYDYQRTRFGGWPWGSDAPVHERSRGRFARHGDGTEEEPG